MLRISDQILFTCWNVYIETGPNEDYFSPDLSENAKYAEQEHFK
jgi:hypothetical protein